FVNVPALPDLVYPLPRRTSLWLGFFMVLVFLIPFLLMAMEANSRLAVLDAIARTVGYETQIPDLPDVPPPKPPVPLPDSQRHTPAPAPVEATNTPAPSTQVTQNHAAPANPLPPEKKPRSAASRVIFARAGDTLPGLAYRYYGKSNNVILAKIHAHNPQIKSAYAALLKNQPVALPD